MIETERAIIRPIDSQDNYELFSYRSDAEINKYQGWIPNTIKDVDDFIARNPSEFNKPDTWYQLVIVNKETNEIIGDIGIHFIGVNQSEIGCTLRKSYHGKGLATECLKATIEYLFKRHNKHRIIGSVDPQNTRSIKLLERLGFRKEAHFKESLFIDGKWVDDIIYGLLKREWK